MILLPRGRSFVVAATAAGLFNRRNQELQYAPFSALGRFRIPSVQGRVECKIGIHRGSSSPSFVQFVSPSTLPRIPKIPRRGRGAARADSGRSSAPQTPLLCTAVFFPFLGNSVLAAEDLPNPLRTPLRKE